MKRMIIAAFLLMLLLCSCAGKEPYSTEGMITDVRTDDAGTIVEIDGRRFVFTDETLFVDEGLGPFSGRYGADIGEEITGRFCLAGWEEDGRTLTLLDVSGWQQPLLQR